MNRVDLLLTQLGEEAAEVVQEAAKCLRFGPAEVYHEIGISNAHRVMVELSDLMAIVEMLQEEGVLPIICPAESRRRVHEKKLKVERMLDYSRAVGRHD
jgi:hypothetical protein